jgi:hypothetical protein
MRHPFSTIPLVVVGLLLGASPSRAQQTAGTERRAVDSARVQLLKTRTGTTLVGHVLDERADTVVFETSGGIFTIARREIEELREVRTSRGGEYWPANASGTRLFFGPTGRMLAKGDGYFSNHQLFFLSATGGLADRFTLGGGLSVLPLDNFADNLFFLTPKLGVVQSDNVNVAVGALVGAVGMGESHGGTGGLGYAVATFGSPDASVTVGGGAGFGNDVASTPIFMLGGETRLSRRVALVTENYLTSSADNPIVSYGLRFMGEKIAVDLAFINVLGENAIFPGIPFVDFVFHF